MTYEETREETHEDDPRRSTRPALTVRSPPDALALAPLVLGFQPEESVVLLTFGGEGFHARVDLPVDQMGRDAVVDMLMQALRANPCRVVMVLILSDNPTASRAFVDALLPLVTGELELPVVDVIRADGQRWWRMSADGEEGPGCPYDVRSHPFTAEAVLRGTVVHRSRDQLGEMFTGGDLELARQVEQALASNTSGALPLQGPDRRSTAAWLRETVEAWSKSGALGAPRDVARVLALVDVPDLRDVVWGASARESAPQDLRTWILLVQVAPWSLSASPAALVALYAWLGGDGALAWTAVERSREADPDNSLAALVGKALERAIPPSTWQPWRVEELLALHE